MNSSDDDIEVGKAFLIPSIICCETLLHEAAQRAFICSK